MSNLDWCRGLHHATGTKAKIEAQIIRRSPNYFIRNYVPVKDSMSAAWVPFDLYPYQEELLKYYSRHKRILVVKARQIGFTTLTEASFVHSLITSSGIHCASVSQRLDDAVLRIQDIREMINLMPEWLWDHFIPIDDKGSSKSIKFKGNGWIRAFPNNETTGRSHTFQRALYDEWGRYTDPEGCWAGAVPTLSGGGQGIFGSSSPGPGSFMQEQWNEQERSSKSRFKLCFYGWQERTDRVKFAGDREWYDEQKEDWFKQGKSQATFYQEFPETIEEAWTAATDAVFDAETLNSQPVRPPECVGTIRTREATENERQMTGLLAINEFIEDPNGGLNIWEMPRPGEAYAIGADVCGGPTARSWSAFAVIHASGRVVATYRGKPTPSEYGELLFRVGTFYNHAVIAVEVNNNGSTPQYVLESKNYSNIYRRRDEGDAFRGIPPGWKFGWAMSKTTKQTCRDALMEGLRVGTVQVPCAETVKELTVYSWVETSGGNVTTAGKPNDDRVDCLMIAEVARRYAHTDAAPRPKTGHAPFSPEWWDEKDILQEYESVNARLVGTLYDTTGKELDDSVSI